MNEFVNLMDTVKDFSRLEILESNLANFEMLRETWGTVENPTWPTIFSQRHSKMEYKIYYIERIQNIKA